MLRRLTTASAVLSLLLCASTAVLWIESYRNPRTIERNHFLGWMPVSPDGRAGGISRIRHTWLMLARGRVEIHFGELRQSNVRPPDAEEVAMWNSLQYVDPPQSQRGPWWTRMGFEWQWDPHEGVLEYGISAYGGAMPQIRRVAAPLWALTILTGALPTIWLAAVWRRRRRMVQGRCATCGYDLRASTARCPECGTPIA